MYRDIYCTTTSTLTQLPLNFTLGAIYVPIHGVPYRAYDGDGASTFEITRFNKQVINFARALHVHYTIDLRACLHGVGDSGLVGLVSFVFTHWGTQNKRSLPH